MTVTTERRKGFVMLIWPVSMSVGWIRNEEWLTCWLVILFNCDPSTRNLHTTFTQAGDCLNSFVYGRSLCILWVMMRVKYVCGFYSWQLSCPHGPLGVFIFVCWQRLLGQRRRCSLLLTHPSSSPWSISLNGYIQSENE
jgi:hypothetical protein